MNVVAFTFDAMIVLLGFLTKRIRVGALRNFGWRSLFGWMVRFDEIYEGMLALHQGFRSEVGCQASGKASMHVNKHMA